METIELRQKLHHYIDNAEQKELEAIFLMVKDEIMEAYNHWMIIILYLCCMKENNPIYLVPQRFIQLLSRFHAHGKHLNNKTNSGGCHKYNKKAFKKGL